MLRPESPPTRTSAADWRMSVALMVCVAAVATAFGPLFTGGSWWVVSVTAAVLVLGCAQVARSAGLRTWRAPLAAAILWMLVATGYFAASTAIVGLVPTPSTIGRFGELLGTAGTIATEQAAPVPAGPSVMFLLVLGVGGLALLTDVLTFWLRAPAVTGIGFFGLLALPSVIVGDAPHPLGFIACLAAWLWLLWIDARRREAGPATVQRTGRSALVVGGFLVVAVIVGLAAPSILPRSSVASNPFSTATGVGFEVGINPMVELGEDLRRGASTTALRYTSTSGASYLKVVNLYGFNGRTWRPGSGEARNNGDLSDLGEPVGLSPEVEREEVTTTVNVEALRSPWLPLPYPTTSVEGLRGDWRSEGLGKTVATSSSRLQGQNYEVTSLELDLTAEQVRAAPRPSNPAVEPYVSLPREIPEQIARITDEVTADAESDYDRAVALQEYFRNGDFEYSESAPVEEGYDGNGLRVLEEFLEVKSGYCVHFASAMAVMARTLDIPTRIAIGYLPGDLQGTSSSGDPVYQVRSDKLHSWPELYFEGIGWLPFEPTPGRGEATRFTEPGESIDEGGEASVEEESQDAQEQADLEDAEARDAGSGSADDPGGLQALYGLLVLTALAAVPAVVRLLQRPWRLRGARSSDRPAAVAWGEVEATAVDFGVPHYVADTPRTLGRRLNDSTASTDALDRLLASVERERYGPVPGGAAAQAYTTQALSDTREIVRSIRADAHRWQRVRARVLPRSLLGRRTVDERSRSIAAS